MFFSVFGSVLLPLTLVVTLAYLLGRYRRVDPRHLASVTFYLFNPCLGFTSMAASTVPTELLGRLVLLKLGGYLVMLPLARWAARRLGLTATATSAFLLVTMFANSGNFGLSVGEYAFGQDGLALAVVGYLCDNLAMNSLGVYVAARGRTTARAAVLQIFLNPAVYAVVLGIMAREFGWELPLALQRPIEMLSRAAVPTMLAVLGLQLAVLPLAWHHLKAIGVAAALRLVAGPLIAIGLAVPLGLQGLARQVGIMQAAPPAAVTNSILATQYDAEPSLAAGAVLISSIASLLTVTALLTWFG